MEKFLISASILSADLAYLMREVNAVFAAGVDMIHIDVMDNHYVPNLTFGPLVCEVLQKNKCPLPLDVHLMVQPVDALITAFARAGASQISFHPEATQHLDRSLQLIRDLGCKAGLALNPATPLFFLNHVWDKLDFILMMSVNPGFAGQTFLIESLNKIREARHFIKQKQYTTRLAVDGGINLENIASIAEAGADTFILGSTIFNSNNYEKTLKTLRTILKNTLE